MVYLKIAFLASHRNLDNPLSRSNAATRIFLVSFSGTTIGALNFASSKIGGCGACQPHRDWAIASNPMTQAVVSRRQIDDHQGKGRCWSQIDIDDKFDAR